MTIARIWKGATRIEDRDRYIDYLHETGIADYTSTPGNLGVELLVRDDGDRTWFTFRTLWESMDAVKAFAGDDPEVAKYYAEDEAFLVERGPTVEHHEVVFTAP